MNVVIVYELLNASAWHVYNKSPAIYDKTGDLNVELQWECGSVNLLLNIRRESLFRAPTQTHTSVPQIYGKWLTTE